MKVVINALAYKQNSSGIGVMIRELFSPLAALQGDKCRLAVSKDSPALLGLGAGTEIRSPYEHGQNLRRMLFQTIVFGRKYCQKAVLVTTDSKIPFFLPRTCRVVTVVTDLAVYRMGNVYRLSRTLWWRLQYRYVRHRADHYAAISEFTKSELVALMHVPPDKIDVVSCAGNPSLTRVEDTKQLNAVRCKYALGDAPYVLFVGNRNPRKNLQRTISAFNEMKTETGIPHLLVIAGEQGWKFDRTEVLKGISCEADVRFLGFVPDEELPLLYSAAEGFVFPTLYEGFGIPVLEAQQCGTPVITSNCSALPETGGDAALYVDPTDTASIAAAMVQLLTDENLRQELIRKGYENAKRFSWDRSAEKLDEIIEKVVAECRK